MVMGKRLLVMAALLAVLFGGLFGFDYFRQTQIQAAYANYRPPPQPVTVSPATTQPLPRSLSGVGTIEAVRQVMVSPEVGGRVTALHFQPGSKVAAGTPLLQLNDAPERGELQRLRAQAKLASINLERSRQLLKLAVSQSELDAQQAALDEVKASIATTEALIQQKQVRAPFAGQLGVRQAHLGQYLNPGAPIVTLTDLSALLVNIELPEQSRAKLSVGQPVNFTVDAHPGRVFAAEVIAIEPQIGPATRSIGAQARLDNRDGLLSPGMFADATLLLPPQPDVLMVPETAIDHSIHGDSVYVVHREAAAQGKPERLTVNRVLVTTGRHDGDHIAIESGLKTGDLVVTTGQLNLREGADVAVVDNNTLSDEARRQQGLPQ
jgi:multidrug efflux system membrane fusion protein